MAARRLGNAQQEIEEVRSRLFLKRWDTTSFDVRQRLLTLRTLIGTESGDELHRHVVVASVAALQTFHRGTIVAIVDSGSEYKIRAAESVTEKLPMKDALMWLSGNTVTFGELFAHSAPCNGVSDLLSWLNNLLACDVKQAIAEAISPTERRNGTIDPRLVVPDVDLLLTNLSDAFRLRHIFAHEAAPNVIVDASTCEKILTAVTSWINAIDAILWASVYANLPLTQAEMNEYAGREVSAARAELAIVLKQALSDARVAENASWLRVNHFAWMKVTMDWSRNTYGRLEGTMWPSVGGNELAKALRARAEQVRNWVATQDPG